MAKNRQIQQPIDEDDEVFTGEQVTEHELPDSANFHELVFHEPPINKDVTGFWRMPNGSIGHGVGANYGDSFRNKQSKSIKDRYITLDRMIAYCPVSYLSDEELEHHIAVLEARNQEG